MRVIVVVFCFLVCSVSAQDTNQVFTVNDLVNNIKLYHPAAKQANLILSKGTAELLGAKGGFDPVLDANTLNKQFDGKNYYQHFASNVKMATKLGVSLKAGFEQNNGQFLNEEFTVPENGLWHAGLTVPLGYGLWIDERRAALKQAEIYAKSTSYEQQNMLNGLFLDAIKYYWKWTEAYYDVLIIKDALQLAETRFRAVKRSYQLGDKPAVDTLESYIQIQNRQQILLEYELKLKNAKLDVSAFLWLANNEPLILNENVIPLQLGTAKNMNLSVNLDSLNNDLQAISLNHPTIELYRLKVKSLGVERKLYREQIKPTLDISYNFLAANNGSDLTASYSVNNYKWSGGLYFPLLARKARGKLKLTDVKIQETGYQLSQKNLELRVKLKQSFNEIANAIKQVSLLESTVANYKKLLQAERIKFLAGESSLFLINSREIKLIEYELKLVKAKATYHLSRAGYTWVIGDLGY